MLFEFDSLAEQKANLKMIGVGLGALTKRPRI